MAGTGPEDGSDTHRTRVEPQETARGKYPKRTLVRLQLKQLLNHGQPGIQARLEAKETQITARTKMVTFPSGTGSQHSVMSIWER